MELCTHTEEITGNYANYSIVVGGNLDGFNTAAYVSTDNEKNMREVPRFEPNRYLVIENIGERDLINPQICVNKRRCWFSVDDILSEITHPGMDDEAVALAIYRFFSSISVNAHNNYMRVDHFLPDKNASPSYNTFKERADPVRAINIYYTSGCVLSAANFVILARHAGLEARAISASPLEGPYAQHATAEVYYDSAYHLFDPEARAFFLKKDNHTIASYEDIHKQPELVYRTHAHGFAAPETRAAFISHYRKFYPPYQVPVEQWTEPVKLRLRPNEKLVYHWGHKGKFRYGFNPRGTPRCPYRLANGQMIYKPKLTKKTYRKGIVSEVNIQSVADDGRTPHLHAIVPHQTAYVIYKIESYYPIVGAEIGAQFYRKTLDDSCCISLCLGPPPWTCVWKAETAGKVEAAINIDNILNPLEKEAIRRFYVKFEFLPHKDILDVGIEAITLQADLQMTDTALPALSVGRNHITYHDESKLVSEVRITHCWQQSNESVPPQPPPAPVFPPMDSEIPIDQLNCFRWQPTSDPDGQGITTYHIYVSQRPDKLIPVSPNFDRLTFSGEPEWRAPSSFWRRETTYYWCVRACNEWGAWSDWSTTWRFMTQ